MPTISVSKFEIERLLNKNYDPENFSDILFDFGLEIDEIEKNDTETSYKIEIPANRYDLLCAEGLSNSLHSYLFNKQFIDIKLLPSQFEIKKKYFKKRSCVASAIIKNFSFDKISYDSFISYQEKLCGSLGRNRSLVSMGTHDLDKISWPVTFKSIKKNVLDFVPLNCKKQVQNLEEHFKDDKNISKYLQYLDDDEYVVFEDNNNDVISVPPVINSNKTKISLDTRNILVEVTGTNSYKVNTCLKMLLSAFRTEEMYSVNITGEEIEKTNEKIYTLTLEEVYKELNIKIDIDTLENLLIKMMYQVIKVDDKSLNIIVPSIRQDVIHKADIIEDIAICYGYNNIKMIMPDLSTIGSENRLNKFSDKLRLEMSMLGFIEVYTMVLVSRTDDKFEKSSALVENYKSLECEVVRNSLYPGLLKSVSSNLHCKIPIKIFELGDVVNLSKNDVGAANRRMLSCLFVGNKSHLEEIQGPMTTILEKCGIKNFQFENFYNEKKYLKNQSAVLKINGEVYGSIGVCSGDVMNRYKIPYSGSMFELDIEKIYEKFFK
ncbi:phenylalanine-tRNA ligase beta subunit (FARSB) [Vairimorpha necatrix]|uniref:phenylalanine--tRNA ligase n=1 Tax=Vairimorpha necatrix TaxID=6039 RepID=A0AAX4JGF6_9MICR